jgi:hypothetical protein
VYCNISEIVGLLEKSSRGETDLSYATEFNEKLTFYDNDKNLELEYDGSSIIVFFIELMEHFKVKNDSP